MSSAASLTDSDIGLIMGMISTYPELSNQEILSYFTRPGRDINHRVIAEIRGGGHRRPGVHPAIGVEVDLFISDSLNHPWLSPSVFVHRSIRLPASPWRLMLNWWPVGQGLFSSGAVVGERGPPLNWVYDCGTTSTKALLDKALRNFLRQQDAIGASRNRLCVLSHFDQDHVSGIVRLIDRMPVTTLLLPYVPLWQRLVIALEQGIEADDPFFDFFLDPVAYLAGGGREGRIGEIVFVPGSGPDDLPSPEPEDFEGGPSGGEIDLKVEQGDPPEDASSDPAATSHAGVHVRFLRPGGRVLALLLWEFVPYNDASLSPRATPAFLAAAAPLVTTLRDDPANRAQALSDLKTLYDRHFGSTSELRNLISLFLYSGPLGRLRPQSGLLEGQKATQSSQFGRCAQIYTGDGTLDAGPRFDAFERFFSRGGRLARTAFFQVMHHGSKRNWHRGIAAKVQPSISLFSSDPAHRSFRHPHAEVLRDFWPYGAVQIDRERGYRFDCWMSA
ncbi:MAG: hypothetical protein PGN25_05470 [Methylorubrum populi]